MNIIAHLLLFVQQGSSALKGFKLLLVFFLRAVVGASVKSLFNLKKPMPACVLFVGNSPSGQRTANCLASKLAASFKNAFFRKFTPDPETFDSAQLSGAHPPHPFHLLALL